MTSSRTSSRKPARLSDQAVIILGGRVAAQALQVLSAAILARVWTPDELGMYRQVILVCGIIVPFIGFGLQSSPYFFIPRLRRSQQKAFVLQMWVLQLLGGAIATVALYFGAEPLAAQVGDMRLVPLLRVYSLFPLFTFFRSTQHSMLISMQRPLWAALMGLVAILFQPMTVAVGAWAGMDLPLILLLVSLLSGLQFIILAILAVRYWKDAHLEWDVALLKDHAQYCLPLSVTRPLERNMHLVDKAIVSVLFDTATYAVYSTGALKLPFVGLVVRSVMDPVRPRLSRFWLEGRKDRLLALWHEAIRRTSLLMLPLTVGAFVLAEPIIVLLYSDKYVESVLPFRIYLLGIPAQIFTAWAVLESMRKTPFIAGVHVSMLVSATLIGLFMSKLFGWVGPAIGLTLTFHLRNAIYVYGVMKHLDLRLSGILPWKSLGQILLLAVVSGCAIYPIARMNLHPILQIAAGGVIYAALYGVVGYGLGVIQRRDVAPALRWSHWAWRRVHR